MSPMCLRGKRTMRMGGAQEGTRTPTPFGIRPSSVRVYQFHHLSAVKEKTYVSGRSRRNSKIEEKPKTGLIYSFPRGALTVQ